MLSTRALLFPLLFAFLTAVFPILAQQADNMGPIRSVAAISHCGKPLQGHTLAPRALVANRTVVSLIVEDNLMNYLVRVGVGNPPRNCEFCKLALRICSMLDNALAALHL